MTSITVNGNNYNDQAWHVSNNPNGLANAGWRQNNKLITMLLDVLADASSGNVDTSVSSLAIATGSKAFTLVSNRPYPVGAFVLAASEATPANYMFGQVTDHTGSVLTVSVTKIGGSGTLDDWNIVGAGPPGNDGADGADYWLDATRVVSTASPSAPQDSVNKGVYEIDLSGGEVQLDLHAPDGDNERVKVVLADGDPGTNNLRIKPQATDKVMGQTAGYVAVVDSVFTQFELRAVSNGASPPVYDWRF